jgi:uncharacterized membrane protein YhiD involved in acid resistance
MPDWLSSSLSVNTSVTMVQLCVRLVFAACYGGCVAAIYRLSHGRQREDAAILTATLVLLSILIAMVSMVIGDNVARAFSLVGALSIVRFRTVVEDTRDTAFVIFAVIVGMAAGAGLLLVPVVGIPLVGLIAVVLSRSVSLPRHARGIDGTLSIRMGLGHDPEKLLGDVLKRHLETYQLKGTSTARQGSALDLNYNVRLRSEAQMPTLVMELNQVEGVQSVGIHD